MELVSNTFLKAKKWLLSKMKKAKNSFGFTLIEVLASIGILGGMVLTVSYMNVSNLMEIDRHNAESYADLIADNQFASLNAFKNQIAFDDDSSTNWNNDIYAKADGSTHYYIDRGSGATNDSFFKMTTNDGSVTKTLTGQGGAKTFSYYFTLSKIKKSASSSDFESNLVKVTLTVSWNERGGVQRNKTYYTILGNYQ